MGHSWAQIPLEMESGTAGIQSAPEAFSQANDLPSYGSIIKVNTTLNRVGFWFGLGFLEI